MSSKLLSPILTAKTTKLAPLLSRDSLWTPRHPRCTLVWHPGDATETEAVEPMGARLRCRTASLLIPAAALFLIWMSGFCRSDEWRTHSFFDAGIQFELPDTWTVHVARPGQEPEGLDSAPAATSTKDGAVVTALPLLEDAALVIVAPQNQVSPEVFARQAKLFLPLDTVVAAGPPTQWGNGSFQGWASAGHGKIMGSGTTVDWRWVSLDVDGHAIVIYLYAESSQAPRYNDVFDRILRSVSRLDTATPK